MKQMLARLDRWKQKDFLALGDYYGGYQDWLGADILGGKKIGPFYRNRACGVVAANNVAIYLALNSKDKEGLFPRKVLTWENYIWNMRDLYDKIRPKWWGIPTLFSLAWRFQAFAKRRGIRLRPYYKKLAWFGTEEREVVNYLIDGLSHNSPVLLLTWNVSRPDLKDLKYHWVTITGLYRQGGQYFILTSNWARPKTYNLSRWIQMPSLYKGLVYFREEEKK